MKFPPPLNQLRVASLIRHNYTAGSANNPPCRLVSLKIAARQTKARPYAIPKVSRSNFSTRLCPLASQPTDQPTIHPPILVHAAQERVNRRGRGGTGVCTSRSLIRLGQISTQMQTRVVAAHTPPPPHTFSIRSPGGTFRVSRLIIPYRLVQPSLSHGETRRGPTSIMRGWGGGLYTPLEQGVCTGIVNFLLWL